LSEIGIGGGQQQSEDSLDVATALGALPADERMVILLFYLEDIPIKKICKITGMPEGTVKSHLSRVHTQLARFFKNN